MEDRGPPVDMISNLPSNIIQTMLTLMPMRDAFRTSILSRSWKSHCTNISKLKFDDELFQGSAYFSLSSVKCKLLHIIYPILLLHQGPILEFSLCISQLYSCYEIDRIILHLSRNATVEEFTLCIERGNDHKLLPSFFMLQQLAVLELHNCVFQPPAMFEGFSRLISLHFDNVNITAEVLLHLISNCPLLMDFTLIGDEKHLMGCWNSDFVELVEGLPHIEFLRMSSYPIQCFATSLAPQKLPGLLVHLKYLYLSGLCFKKVNEMRSAFLFITSSPNVERIIMEMHHNPTKFVSQTAMNFIELQDYSCVILDDLHEVTITNFTNMKPLLDFAKLILTNSPMLKLIHIVIDEWVAVDDEVEMLKELIQYPRALVRAKIIFERP